MKFNLIDDDITPLFPPGEIDSFIDEINIVGRRRDTIECYNGGMPAVRLGNKKRILSIFSTGFSSKSMFGGTLGTDCLFGFGRGIYTAKLRGVLSCPKVLRPGEGVATGFIPLKRFGFKNRVTPGYYNSNFIVPVQEVRSYE